MIVLAQAVLDLGTCFLVAWLASLDLVLRKPATGRASSLAGRPVAGGYLPICRQLCGRAAHRGAGDLPRPPPRCWPGGGLLGSLVDAPTGAFRAWHGTTGLLPGCWLGSARSCAPKRRSCSRPWPLVLAVRWRRRADWGKLLRVGALTAVGLLLPLVPWAARNWVRFHEVQFLAPRYAASPDEYIPRGLYAWTATWLVRYRDVYLVLVEYRRRARASRRHSALGL